MFNYDFQGCGAKLINNALMKGCNLLEQTCFRDVAKDVSCAYTSGRILPEYKLQDIVNGILIRCSRGESPSKLEGVCSYIEPSSAALKIATVATALSAAYLAYRGCASLYNRYIKAAPASLPEPKNI